MQASGCQPLPKPVISRLMAMLQSTRQHGARLRPPGLRSSGPGFNPRARTGRDRADESPETLQDLFQSTRPHGARHARSLAVPPAARFQSTRPHGARPNRSAPLRTWPKFQSTRPHGARQGKCRRHAWCVRCFNPRARTGRDLRDGPRCACCGVSIHAPARGATASISRVRDTGEVSIHAPARGATRPRAVLGCCSRCFNPRARTGRDARRDAHDAPPFVVSIHAPARGATWPPRR